MRGEQSGERPALVLSDSEFNALTGYIFVAPATSKRRGWPFEVVVPVGAKIDGLVLADQTKSIDYVARRVRYRAAAPPGLGESVLAQVGAILAI